jgi:hypothetical protein
LREIEPFEVRCHGEYITFPFVLRQLKNFPSWE